MGLPKSIRRINEWLADTYGKDVLDRPYYRIVWSEDQLEKRKGEFHIFSGPIFVRAFYGVQEIKKYMYHPSWRERWILEKLDYTYNPELVENNGHYEPLYVFYDKDGNYQRPELKHVQFYMFHLLKHRPWKTDKQKWNDLNEAEKEERRKEEEFFYGCLEDEFGGELAAAIHQGEGVVNPGVIYDADGNAHKFNRSSDGSNSGQHSALPAGGEQAGSATS